MAAGGLIGFYEGFPGEFRDLYGDFLGNQTKGVIVTLKNRASMGMGIHGK